MNGALAVGPFVASTDMLMLVAVLVVATVAGSLAGRRDKVSVSGALFDAALAGLVAARIAFVIAWFGSYAGDPWAMLDIRDGGFVPWAGLAAGVVVAAWKGWRSPGLRRPLAVAAVCGAITWGLFVALPQPGGRNAPVLPTLALDRLEGGRTTLSDVAGGKPAVVNLWATWCPPCRREMPVLAAAQKQDGDVRFVFVDQSEDADAVRQFVAAMAPGLGNVLLDPNGDLGRELAAPGLPTTLFFDASGRLVDTHVGALSSASLAAKLAAVRGRTVPASSQE